MSGTGNVCILKEKKKNKNVIILHEVSSCLELCNCQAVSQWQSASMLTHPVSVCAAEQVQREGSDSLKIPCLQRVDIASSSLLAIYSLLRHSER